jgi:hypothetical protein
MLTDGGDADVLDSGRVSDQLRSELIWLSAQEAHVRDLAFTRSLTPPEWAQITQLRARSEVLRTRRDRAARRAAAASC